MSIWEASAAQAQPLAAYLWSRAIGINPLPEALRWHAGKNMMVALVKNGAGQPVAIHRTFLDPSITPDQRKKMLGPVKCGAVRLGDPGADGTIAIGEGIETCLSFQQVTGIPTWAALSEGGLRGIDLPAGLQKVYILADIDAPKDIRGVIRRVGQEAARKAARRIADMGIAAAIVWPGVQDGAKIDFNDLLRADDSGASIRAALDHAEAITPAAAPPLDDQEMERPTVRVMGGNLPQTVEQAERALIDAGVTIFQRSSQLVRTVNLPKASVLRRDIQRADRALVIMPVDTAWLDLELTRHANFERWNERKNGWASIDSPLGISRAIMANAGRWQFLVLAGVVEAPTMRPDGTILSTPGYDEATGLYLETSGVVYPAIPDFPSRDEALAALAVLSEAIAEFPFKAEIHKTAALAGILTALVRRSLYSAPMICISARAPGSGKSLLADLIAMIATGRTAPAITHTDDKAEEKKRILTILAEGDSIALIDNVERGISSDALCSILTQETYMDRLLGATKSITAQTNLTWIATGNNLSVRGDLSSRVIMILIDPAVERPEERSFSKDLKTWIPANRKRLVAAGLTVLRAYAAAGRPATGLPPFGRFEEWARVVRDALVWCGLPDACATRVEVEDSDPIRSNLGMLLHAWHGAVGGMEITLADLLVRARHLADPPQDHYTSPDERQEADPSLLAAMQEIAGDVKGNINTRKLGWFLRKYRGRIEGGLKLVENAKKDRKGIELWAVRQTDDGFGCGIASGFGKNNPAEKKQTNQTDTENAGFCRVTPIPHVEFRKDSHIYIVRNTYIPVKKTSETRRNPADEMGDEVAF